MIETDTIEIFGKEQKNLRRCQHKRDEHDGVASNEGKH